MNVKRNDFILCLSQVLCIACPFILAKIVPLLVEGTYLLDSDLDILLFFISPPLIAAIVALALSVVLPIEADFMKATMLSIPGTIIYFFLYTMIPYVLIGFDEAVKVLPTTCLILVPLTFVGFLVMSIAIRLGAMISSKRFGQPDISN